MSDENKTPPSGLSSGSESAPDTVVEARPRKLRGEKTTDGREAASDKKKSPDQVMQQRKSALERELAAQDALSGDLARLEEATEDDPAADQDKQDLAAQKKLKRKKLIKRSAWGGGALFFAYAIYWLFFIPFKGGMTYGICKTFLELNLPFPSTMGIARVEDFGMSVRIWYTHIDAFGEYRMEPIQCFFRQDPERGPVIDKITIRRREIEKSIVETFNSVLPAIAANPPDLTIPAPPPDNLRDLHFETDQFRKKLF